jgi:hypothetical protein
MPAGLLFASVDPICGAGYPCSSSFSQERSTNMDSKNSRTNETIRPNDEAEVRVTSPRRDRAKDALKRDILRVSTNIRAGGNGDDDGNDV